MSKGPRKVLFAAAFLVGLASFFMINVDSVQAHSASDCDQKSRWGIDGSSTALSGLVIRTKWVSYTGTVRNFNTNVTVRAHNDDSIQQAIEGAYGGTRVRERTVSTGDRFYIDYGTDGSTPRTECRVTGYSVWGYGKDEWGHDDWGDTWGLDCFVNATGITEKFTARAGSGPAGVNGDWDDDAITFSADNGRTVKVTFTFREDPPAPKVLKVRARDENENALQGVKVRDLSGNGYGGETSYTRSSVSSISANLQPAASFGSYRWTGCFRIVDRLRTRVRNICSSSLPVSVTNSNPEWIVYALYNKPSYTLRIETTHNFPSSPCAGGSACVSVRDLGSGATYTPLATITSDSPISGTFKALTRTYYYPREDVSYIFRDWIAGNVSYSTGERLLREITFSQPASKNGGDVNSFIRANYEILTYKVEMQAIDTHGRVIGTTGDPFDPGVSFDTASPDNCSSPRHPFNPGDHRYGGKNCSPKRFTPYTITDVLPIPFTAATDSAAKLTVVASELYEASNNVYKFDHFEIGPLGCTNHDTGADLCGGANEDLWIVTAPYCSPGFCGVDNATRSVTFRNNRLSDEYSTTPRVRAVYRFVRFSVTE